MDYNIFSKVESIQSGTEELETYFEKKAAVVADKLLPDNELPPDTPSDTPYLSDHEDDDEEAKQDEKEKKTAIESDDGSLPRLPLIVFPHIPAKDKDAGDVRVKAYKNLPECCLRNFLKGFAIGASGRLAIGVMSSVVTLMRVKGSKGRQRALSSILGLEMEPLQYGFFLGSLLAGHNSVVYGTRRAKGRVERYRCALAGGCAALALRFLPRGVRRSIALITLVRALEVGARMAAQRGWIPGGSSSWPHADMFIMAAASARVMWCWIFAPRLLDPAYLTFLNRIGAKPEFSLSQVPKIYSRTPLSAVHLARVNAERLKLALPSLLPGEPLTLPGLMYKPGETTFTHFMRYTREGFMRAAKVYLPVHVLPLLLFNSKRLMSQPVQSAWRTTEGVCKSSLFLSTYCSLGWFGVDVTSQLSSLVVQKPNRLSANLSGHIAGAMCAFALFFEKPNRRIELALYTSMQGIRTLFNHFLKGRTGFVTRQLKHGEVGMFCASLALIIHAYAHYPTTIRQTYYRLMLRLFDSPHKLHKPFCGL